MYKLIIFCGFLACCFAAPKPKPGLLHGEFGHHQSALTSGIVETYSAPIVSSYSTSIAKTYHPATRNVHLPLSTFSESLLTAHSHPLYPSLVSSYAVPASGGVVRVLPLTQFHGIF